MSAAQDVELTLKAKKTSEKVLENVYIVANDPSLAFFRIQEHVRKILPPFLDKKDEVLSLHENMQGHCYDMEYAVSAVKLIETSEKSFKNIEEMLKTAIFLKQQLKYEDMRSRSNRHKSLNSNKVYKRFSAHLTLDLPEFPDISIVMRETTNRVETMVLNGRSIIGANNVGELQRSYTTLH